MMMIIDGEQLSSLLSWACVTTTIKGCCHDGSGVGGRLLISCNCGHCYHRGCDCEGITPIAIVIVVRGMTGRDNLRRHYGKGRRGGVNGEENDKEKWERILEDGFVLFILSYFVLGFWFMFFNAFHLISALISVCCCYHCGEKRLVNSIKFFSYAVAVWRRYCSSGSMTMVISSTA